MNKSISAYPLAWPAGWTRTGESQRMRAKFHGSERQHSTQPGGGSWLRKRDLTIAEGTSRVLAELQRFGVLTGDAIISTNLVLRFDGLPRSDQRAPSDPGVAVYWQRPGEPMKCMAIDLYERVADNLAAIAATLEAMRAIERHGGAQILDRAFSGFTALPAPGQTTGGWRVHLGFPQDASPTLAEAEQAYRWLRGQHHPDKPGGDAALFHQVQLAWEQAQQELDK
jgi:hypothetical protein